MLASGIHDAKNQLFLAESLIAATEAEHGLSLGEARYAIEAASDRLSRTLAAYRVMRHSATPAITPVILEDLCDEVMLAQKLHLAAREIKFSIDCQVFDAWPLDRDLVTDMLNNAVQNAGRYALSSVKLSVTSEDEWLYLVVEDDGPGFPSLPPVFGIGLLVADRLAALHLQHGRQGSLTLSNESSLGGARFELRLP
jgi:signal transduction histidine kinase